MLARSRFTVGGRVKKSHQAISRFKAARISRVKRPQKQNTVHTQGGAAAPQDSSTANTEDSTRPGPHIDNLTKGWEFWKFAWAILGPIVALTTFYFNFTPSVSITPTVNIDKTQTYSTQIEITNTGRVPIYDLIFSCGISTPGARLVVGKLSTCLSG